MKRFCLFMILALLCSPAGLNNPAQAEDANSDRLEALSRFSKALEKEQNLSQELKDSLKDLVTELAEVPSSETSTAPETPPAAVAKDSASAEVLEKVAAEVKKTKVAADFRLRHETDPQLSVEARIDTETDEDTGYPVGAAIGDAAKQGEWKIYYNWMVVEQDAVFTPLSHDDFILNSNYRTHLVGAKYMLLDKLELHLWTSITTPDKGEDADEARDLIGLNVSL